MFPEWYAQNIRKTLTGVESKEQLNNQFIEGMTAVQGEYSAAAFSEGGIIPAKPQLVIVGEGGEKEYIVPESKLAYFLGSDAAIGLKSWRKFSCQYGFRILRKTRYFVI